MDIEFTVTVTDLPSIRLGSGYASELREVRGRHFGLLYPKVEDDPAD